jgi:hypothetical protein
MFRLFYLYTRSLLSLFYVSFTSVLGLFYLYVRSCLTHDSALFWQGSFTSMVGLFYPCSTLQTRTLAALTDAILVS